MLDALEALRPGAATALATDPVAELRSWPEIEMRLVPESETGAGCSVSGAYLPRETPPRLAVATSTSSGRRGFTALHELGHHLQQTNLELMDAFAAQPDGGVALEDAACDAFAAAVLLPADLVDRFTPSTGPTGANIADLVSASSASRAAACVRASERLRSPGLVVLLNRNGVVEFSAAHGLPPVRKGSDQSQIPVLREAISSGRLRATGMTRVLYRDGIRGQELYADVGEVAGYLVLVAVTDHAPWITTFTLPTVDDGPQGAERICVHPDCGHEFPNFEKACQRCGVPKCPECQRCQCPSTVAQRDCSRCTVTYPVRAFDGDSTICENCA